jgi:hypothetical protein
MLLRRLQMCRALVGNLFHRKVEVLLDRVIKGLLKGKRVVSLMVLS